MYCGLVPTVLILAGVLWKHHGPPGVAYVAFVSAAGALLFVTAIDTRWYEKVPTLLAGDKLYQLISRTSEQEQRLKRVSEFVGQLAATLGVPTPTPLPTPTVTPVGIVQYLPNAPVHR